MAENPHETQAVLFRGSVKLPRKETFIASLTMKLKGFEQMKSKTRARRDETSSTKQRLAGETLSSRKQMTKPKQLGLKMQNILVPTDFSEPSKKALRYAISFAGQFGARITLLHVVEPMILPYEDYPLRQLILNDKGLVKAARETLRSLCRHEKIDVSLLRKRLVRLGSPSEEIANTARDLQADLIIIATHGYTGLKRIFIGSTTERVVRRAHCPVLVVRKNEREFIFG